MWFSIVRVDRVRWLVGGRENVGGINKKGPGREGGNGGPCVYAGTQCIYALDASFTLYATPCV